MRKKSIFSIIFTLVILSILAGNVYGAEESKADKSKKVLFEVEEVFDSKELYKRAKEEEKNEKTIDKLKEKNVSATLNNGNSKVEVETVSTTQLLKIVQEGDVLEETYAVTAFASPTLEDMDEVSALSTYSRSGSKTDGSVSARANATIYYTRTTVGGASSIALKSGSASWAILDSAVQLENRRFQMVASGSNNGVFINQVDVMRYPSSNNTTTYQAPYNWKPVAINPDTMNVGVNTFIDIRRGTSRSTLSFIFRY